MIVDILEMIILIGGVGVLLEDVSRVMFLCLNVIVVDGGVDVVLDVGVELIYVIGDLDSFSFCVCVIFVEIIVFVVEQEMIDFEKCFLWIFVKQIFVFGFLGGCFDYQLFVLNVLVWFCDCNVVLFGEMDVCVLVLQGGLMFEMLIGICLLLMFVSVVWVWLFGLCWDLLGEVMIFDGFVSILNEVDGQVSFCVDGVVLMVVLVVYFEMVWMVVSNLVC